MKSLIIIKIDNGWDGDEYYIFNNTKDLERYFEEKGYDVIVDDTIAYLTDKYGNQEKHYIIWGSKPL